MVLMEGLNQQVKASKDQGILTPQMKFVPQRVHRNAQDGFDGIEIGVAWAADLTEKIVLIDDNLDRC